MKSLNQKILVSFLLGLILISCQSDGKAQNHHVINPNTLVYHITDPLPTEKRHPSKKIKLALLLDTSGSMDGLIEQAKSQLWSMVNELADAKCDNLRPTIEIALYEYGNDRLSSRNGFIRMVTPLTQNLDQLSEDLFALTTNGGSEHCGQVIHTSLNDLQWSESGEDLQVIFIAGNEPFTQGPISYQMACKQALQNKVTVNTIFCGDFNQGINTFWKNGAKLTGGEYMSIDHNSRTVFIESPYDKRISELNDRLNDTYLYYGKSGSINKQKQVEQDVNAESYGLANKVIRAVTKSKHVYRNSSWDLVDASSIASFDVETLKEEELSDEMKKMDTKEKKAFIDQKSKERAKIQAEITQLNSKRNVFVAQKQKENSTNSTLDNAMIAAITKQAKAKRFEF